MSHLVSSHYAGPELAPAIKKAVDEGDALHALDLCIRTQQRIPDELIVMANEQLALDTPAGQTIRIERYINRYRIVGALVKPPADHTPPQM